MENTLSIDPPEKSQDLLSLEQNFLKQMQHKGRSHNTIKNYRTDLDCFNQYLVEQQKRLDISRFDLPQILNYGEFLQKKYSSHNSRRRRVQALRIFFDFLVEQGYFNSNPVRKIPTSPKILDIPRPTSFLDIKTLWNQLLTSSDSSKSIPRLLAKRNQIITLLIYHGGLKVSDLSNLKQDDITIDKTSARVLINPIKRDPYTIPLPSYFSVIYQEYCTLLEMELQTSKLDFSHLFFNANQYKILSGGLSPRGLEIIFEEWRKKLLIEVTPKSLRQACIMTWLHEKNPEVLIKEWMGVAPNYSLKLYKDELEQHPYNGVELEDLYYQHKKRNQLLH